MTRGMILSADKNRMEVRVSKIEGRCEWPSFALEALSGPLYRVKGCGIYVWSRSGWMFLAKTPMANRVYELCMK